MAERLYGLIVEAAALRGWERVYDLYSGIGSIALTLAPRAGRARARAGRERRRRRDRQRARNEITNASFYAGDVRLALGELVARAGRPDLAGRRPARAPVSRRRSFGA